MDWRLNILLCTCVNRYSSMSLIEEYYQELNKKFPSKSVNLLTILRHLNVGMDPISLYLMTYRPCVCAVSEIVG